MRLLRTRTDGRPGVLLSAALGHGVALAASVAIVFGANACRRSPAPTQFASARSLSGTLTSTDPSVLQHDDGQWVMPAKNYAATRFSGLTEINASNVQQLAVAWTFSTGMVAGHEAAPLVVGDTMYIVTPFPNMLYALRPEPARRADEVAVRPEAARRLAGRGVLRYSSTAARRMPTGCVFFNTLDGRTIAVDAATGQAKWITQLGDINKGETMTMAPLVVKGQGARRQQRRRVRRARLADRARGAIGSGALARLQHRARQGRAHRPELQALLRIGPRHRPRHHDLAGRGVEDRRRHGVGLDLVRPERST